VDSGVLVARLGGELSDGPLNFVHCDEV
jgi:hypothetical protein